MAKMNESDAGRGAQYIVQAQYSEQLIEEYKGNPLIEALPPIFLRDQVEELLYVYPKYNKSERELDAPYRYHCIQRLFKYFQPLSKHFDIEQRISRVIRQGYLSRSPLKPEHASDMQAIYQKIKEHNFDFSNELLTKTNASGFTIIGISGMGKTTSIDRVLSLYPQIVVHSEYSGQQMNQYQLVWLKLDCPFDGSVKGLCTSFFIEFDRLFADNTYKKFAAGRNISVNTMMPRMAQLARNFNLGVLVIDEIQHLSMAKSGGSEKMLNFFVSLVNTIGVPVVLIGTTHAMSILQSEFRQARRGSGQGDMIWDRMKNDIQWDLLVRGLWKYQWMRNYVEFAKELSDVLYEESQGIVDIAVKLFAMAQMKAIATGKETITANVIRQVARENLRLVKPMLDALKSNDLKQIAKYSDIRPIDIQAFYEEYHGKLEENRYKAEKKAESNRLKQESSLVEVAILKLIDLKIDEIVAKDAVERAARIHKSNDLNTLIKESLKFALMVDSPKEQKEQKNKKKEPISQGDLRYLYGEAKRNNETTYSKLKSSGYIKDPMDEFAL